MQQNYFLKSLLFITLLANLAFQCNCQKPIKQISHFNVHITFKEDLIYLEDGHVPFMVTIKSNDNLAKELKYTCVDWLVKDNLGKLVSVSGEPIDPDHELCYGDNQLYYAPHTPGKHMLEITVSDAHGSLKKKQLLTIHVKDHLPVDFQVELKPEKSSSFVHEPVKLILDIGSRQKEAAQLTYQIKEISTDKKGSFSATAQGKPIGPKHDLSYGKNILYYHNIDKQPDIHDIRLVVANSKGDIQAISASLNILETDFQVTLQLQKPGICSYEQAKLTINIASSQVGMDKLAYQIKEISTSVAGGEFLTTPEGGKISAGHPVLYGKNVLYYTPHKPGKHMIQLVVANQGATKQATVELTANQASFSAAAKIEKPAKSADSTWEVGLLLSSNSGLKAEKWELSSWQIEEPGVGTLQDAAGYQVPEKGKLLQSGLNKLQLIFSEEIALKNIPQLKLAIRQPDGEENLLVVDLSEYVFSYLEKGVELLISQYQVAFRKLANKEPFAQQDKFDRIEHQLQTLRSNLHILAQSTTINRDHLEDVLAKIDLKNLRYMYSLLSYPPHQESF